MIRGSVRRVLVVTGSPRALELPNGTVISADAYLKDELPPGDAPILVLNLCRSMGYLSRGYYVSLLAEARGHGVLPTVAQIEAASSPFSILRTLDAAGVPTTAQRRGRKIPEAEGGPILGLDVGEDDLPRSFLVAEREGRVRLESVVGESATALVVLGRTPDVRFRTLASEVYREFPLPLFQLRLVRDRIWKVCGLSLASYMKLSPEGLELLQEGVEELSRRTEAMPKPASNRRSIACLFDPADESKPSSAATLERFDAAADRLDANFTVIDRNDIHRLAEHDALFVRTLTGLDRWPFAFQQRAASLGMPVIDDPLSTIRCSNKVFLREMLDRLDIAQPRSLITTPGTPVEALEALGFPLIVKLPDGSFSKAVKKAKTLAEYKEVAATFFRKSPLILVQEYCPSDYDWRIGVLGGRVLYACRYFMAKGHWQILKTDAAGRLAGSGRVEAISREVLDPAIAHLAVAGARAVGSGLYGVDIKETASGPVIIEINDNPNIDEGYEDQAEKSRLYEEVIQWFLDRLSEEPAAGREGPRA